MIKDYAVQIVTNDEGIHTVKVYKDCFTEANFIGEATHTTVTTAVLKAFAGVLPKEKKVTKKKTKK